jgi:predicted enzyme related to lactoylglutathione lyase
MYVFADAHGLPRQRELLETAVGLPVIEIEPHLPHHRHGAVKYDAGPIIFSLNLASPGKFRPDQSDALVTVFTVDPKWRIGARVRAYGRTLRRTDGELFTDPSGHHYLFRPARDDVRGRLRRPVIEELRLIVEDLAESTRYYRDVLDLAQLGGTSTTARFATGSCDLVLEESATAPDGRIAQRRTCLIVFHAADVEATRVALEQRGADFGNRHAAYSEIGGTARFDDPSGHRLCLYEPSAESLAWESGPKVMEIAAGSAAH